jgi:hypothetical protein
MLLEEAHIVPERVLNEIWPVRTEKLQKRQISPSEPINWQDSIPVSNIKNF